jgi:signal transduction histidine kinase
MAGIAALATAAAIVLGLFLVRRLVRPLHRLRDDARRLGEGDFSIDHEPSGVVEIDEAGDALEATAGRLAGLVERERAFSADASHQLRTPVAGLRTVLEAELEHPRADPGIALRDALGQVDRLEATMNELLALARDAHPAGPFEVDAFLEDVAERWEAAVRSAGRELVVRTPGEPIDVDASPVAMRQVVDVLVDNALRHGQGAITIDAGERAEATALSLRVSDEGDGITGEPEAIFHRRQPDAAGHGIGLSLARSLTEAEGGRLRVTRLRPLELTAVVPAHRRSEAVSG